MRFELPAGSPKVVAQVKLLLHDENGTVSLYRRLYAIHNEAIMIVRDPFE
jgi:hypothetical protein